MIYLGRGLVINVFRSSLRNLKPQLLLQGQRQKSKNLVAFKTLQAKFQVDDGKPVWLKGGVKDRVLYTATLLGCATGLAGVIDTIRFLAMPITWRTDNCNC